MNVYQSLFLCSCHLVFFITDIRLPCYPPQVFPDTFPMVRFSWVISLYMLSLSTQISHDIAERIGEGNNKYHEPFFMYVKISYKRI